MRKRNQALVVVLLLAMACATVGTGDPVVVKAEDFLVNSLNVYDAAMKWHETHSTTETPQVYRIFESARVKFPVAWQAAKNGVAAYKLNHDKAQLDRLLAAVQEILNGIQPLVGG